MMDIKQLMANILLSRQVAVLPHQQPKQQQTNKQTNENKKKKEKFILRVKVFIHSYFHLKKNVCLLGSIILYIIKL